MGESEEEKLRSKLALILTDLEKVTKEKNVLRTELKEREVELDTCNLEINNTAVELHDKEAVLNDLESRLSLVDNCTAILENECNDKSSKIETLKVHMESKNSEEERLAEMLRDSNLRLDEGRKDRKEVEVEMSKLEDDLDSLRKTRDCQQSTLNALVEELSLNSKDLGDGDVIGKEASVKQKHDDSESSLNKVIC